MKTFLEKEKKIGDKKLQNALNSYSNDSKTFERIKYLRNEEEKKRRIQKMNFDANIRYEKLFQILVIYLVIIILPIYSSNKIPSGLRVLEPSVSEIKLIINKTGKINILYDKLDKSLLPSEIIINSKKVDKVQHSYNLTEITNEIILKWNYSLDNCSKMFYNTEDIDEIDLSNFDISSVLYMKEMFKVCGAKNIIFPKSKKNKILDMSSMFEMTSNLKYLDLSGLDTSSVVKMNDMFYFSGVNTLDLSSFNTSLIEDMSLMFNGCTNLTSLNLSSFNTSLVKEMSYMFYYCPSLTSLDLSNFDTSNVENMEGMFTYCSSLTSLDLSNFDTSNVYKLDEMFSGCINLISLNLSSFNTSKVSDIDEMFFDCNSLILLDISNFDLNEKYSDVFTGCSSLSYIKIYSYKGRDNFDSIQNNNLIYCANDKTVNKESITSLIEKNYTNNCSNTCFLNAFCPILNTSIPETDSTKDSSFNELLKNIIISALFIMTILILLILYFI